MLERDADREAKTKEDDFKASIFANNPSMYKSMFGEDVVDDEDVEHLVLDSDEDFNKLIRELKQLGVID